MALHRSIGFTDAGIWHAAGVKFDRRHDVSFWELALGPLDVPSRDPLPVSERTPQDVQAALQTA